MKWISAVGLATLCPVVCYATTYMTVEQVKTVMFPHQLLQQQNFQIPENILKTLQKRSGIRSALKTDQIYKTKNNEWLVVDQVVGKHEMITYAVGLDQNGAVKQIEILEYNESYGSQVNNKEWKSQFYGKNANSELMLNKDIKNLSGATLSAKHITNGVRRITDLYALVLKNK